MCIRDSTLTVGIKAIDATSLGVGGTATNATLSSTSVAQNSTSFNAVVSGGTVTFTAQGSNAAPTAASQNNFVFTVDGTSFTFDAFTHGANTGFGSTADNIGDAFVQFLEDQTTLSNYTFSNNGSGVVTIQKTNSVSVSSTANAGTAMTNIDAAILELNTQRAQLGSYSNRLDSTVTVSYTHLTLPTKA